ncbi:galactokinase [Litoribacter populi]|uniref:galactokinase n=1 Tax=Litoribacter populi TaxID=2598460 RepID=UPI00117EF6A3|nr:galactokinase [Litoribacter populi]
MAKSGDAVTSLESERHDNRSVLQTYSNLYSSDPIRVKAPGRINLIGDHTDYNEGFVLPAAIDMEIELALGKNSGRTCRIFSIDYKEEFIFDLEDFSPLPSGWANYIMGVVAQFQEKGFLITGFDCVFGGDIPIGAGLSSSAALECGVAVGLNRLFGYDIKKIDLIKMAQKAEHTFAGVQCGIMDQFASIMGKIDHVIQLDCRSLDYRHFKLDLQDYEILLCDTQVKHSLADSAYNTRREECDKGVAILSKNHENVASLRDVTLSMLEEQKSLLDPVIYQRCKFVVEENQRVLDACKALDKGDMVGFGTKMYQSHDGLSNLYEVSCAELDLLVEAAKSMNSVKGSRMMGGGFGGCTINLVKKNEAQAFENEMKQVFQKAFNQELVIYRVNIQDGVREIME